MSKISIIVPIYNVAEYLKPCLESIINQTYTDIEIICIDDGSTDESGRICDDYASRDERIIVVHQENYGLVCARKKGLEIATGEYIGFVDGDDYIEPNMYESLLTEIQQHNADVVHSGYITSKKIYLTERFELSNYKDRRSEVLQNFFFNMKITPSIWSKLFKEEVIRKCYAMVPDTQSYGEDLLCLLNLLCEEAYIVIMDKAFYHYVIREDSLSHRVSDKNYRIELDLYECIVERVNRYGLLDSLQNELSVFLRNHMFSIVDRSIKRDFVIQKYCFHDISKIKNKKVVLYGAGQVGRDYYSELRRYAQCEVVSWVDSNYQKYNYACCEVKAVQTIFEVEFDNIVLAVMNEEVADEIRENLILQGVSSEKIIWEKPKYLYG